MQVSVIIPVYNAKRFLAEAVRSALDQPETAEVLLVEDGSTDNSLAICQALADSEERVRLLRHPGGVNRGAGATRNRGIQESRFPFIAFLDADDLYLPGRFRVAREVFEQHPEADGVYGAVSSWAMTEEMRAWKERHHIHTEIITFSEIVPPDRLFEHLITFRDRWHTNGVTVKRELFDRTGLFDEHLLMSQDTAMWLRMAAVGILFPASLDEPVSVRRLHGENRVVRHRDKHFHWHCKMLETVAGWARRKGLPDSIQHVLIEREIHIWEAKIAPTYRIKRFPRIAFLATLPFRQPSALRNRFYLKRFYTALFAPPRFLRFYKTTG